MITLHSLRHSYDRRKSPRDATHLTSHTNDQASVRINALMDRFAMTWGIVK
ncbi:MAG: hypothetical protein H6R15_4371 [Proteobacteria bacterium]|nr:hypothetical protein [Pseudomonadota bacterium]